MRILLILALLVPLPRTWAAVVVPVRQSQQFKVIDRRPITGHSPGQLVSNTGEKLIRLDADVLLLSAERIRDTLGAQLKLLKQPGREIRLSLYIATHPNDVIRVAVGLSPNGWEYDLDVPDQVEEEKLVRGLVGVLLLEKANQGQGPRSADIPTWLVEGLQMELRAVAGPGLVVEAVPLGGMVRNVQVWRGTDFRLDFLQPARAVLRGSPPLSFSELGHPHLDSLIGPRLKTYQFSAQLFVHELLHLPGGPDHIGTMVRALPNCWNWETAFLGAFAAEFPRLLDVEKWWSVNLMAFRSRDPASVRSKVVCLDKLDELLIVPAQVRLTADTLPVRKDLTLEQVILNWDFASQIPVVQQKILQLARLRVAGAPEIFPLIEEYERALSNYLQRRSQANRVPETRMQPTYNSNLVAKDAIEQLERLDKRRQGLRPEETLSVNSTTSP